MKNFSKKIFCALMAVLLIFSFAACGKTNDSSDEKSTDEATVTEQAAAADYMSLYRDFLTELCADEADEGAVNWQFGFFEIDSDSVPELVVARDFSHGGKAEIYTIAGNEVKSVGEYGEGGCCQFGIGNGIIRSFSEGQGLYSYAFLELKDGEAEYIWGGYEIGALDDYDDFIPKEFHIYNSQPDGTHDPDNERDVESAEFNAELEKYESQIMADTYENGAMYELNADNIEYCTDNYGTPDYESRAYESARGTMLDYLNTTEINGHAVYYYTDLNGDGNDDIIYYYGYTSPVVAFYTTGDFKEVIIESEASCGSQFPSGENSGLYIDADNGIIIYRAGGHTVGTEISCAAEAFKVDGVTISSLWLIHSDDDMFLEKYPDEADHDIAVSECHADFEITYESRTTDYNLTNFFDVCLTAE